MTKRTESIEGDTLQGIEFPAVVVFDEGLTTYPINPALQRLIDSNIVTATDSELTWRIGHLEHLANLYASDPRQTWRDYADDLTVALAHDARFAGMVDAAKGE